MIGTNTLHAVPADIEPSKTLLRVRDLSASFSTPSGEVVSVERVSFDLHRGKTLGIVGESGSGKSVLGRTIMGLTGLSGNATVSGQILFDGVDFTNPDKKLRSEFLGSKIAMIFQDPLSSLNPVKLVGTHVTETLRQHDRSLSRRDAKEQAIGLLDKVRIPDPQRRFGQYPHELSGGMRQRVGIAIALACSPQLLVADEPTTALDVTVQKHVLDLLGAICEEQGMAMILVSHDLGVVAGRSDEVMVMYAGRIQEKAPASEFFVRQYHPYAYGLLASKPMLDSPAHAELLSITGRPPDPTDRFPGCRFAPRCQNARAICREQEPLLEPVSDAAPEHKAACFFPIDGLAVRTTVDNSQEGAP
ncbi:ABC transporter ATP-binding protein [Glaciibacter superstes]|uniref:ABC transporter ATP-binding protein n=1 Tax=Glaciibacter superstes TaxID=501023 RepID=UPI0003B746E9|nr:ABC transporter ATP-binding protein [Glaciibacter superstes]